MKIIEIIERVKSKLSDRSDVIWTGYDNSKEFRDDLDGYVRRLEANDQSCLDELNILFAPTGPLQEHSIANGWADEYIRLAERFDNIYNSLKK